MQAQIRSATREDADVCGEICYRAFARCRSAQFSARVPALEVAKAVVTTMSSKPGFYGISPSSRAHRSSNFMDERSQIAESAG